MTAVQFDAAQSLVRRIRVVEEKLSAIREELGISDEGVFLNMTLRQVREAATKTAWCARHGGFRCVRCAICKDIGSEP